MSLVTIHLHFRLLTPYRFGGRHVPLEFSIDLLTSLDSDLSSLTDEELYFGEGDLPEGWVCMPKVMMVEEIEYKDEEHCTHVVQESCFQTYTTVFKNSEVGRAVEVNKII